MIGFLKKLWTEFNSKELRPGYWTSSGDVPIFVYGGDPLSTIVRHNHGEIKMPEESLKLDQLKTVVKKN